MDIHKKVAAALNIACGTFVLSVVCVLTLLFSNEWIRYGIDKWDQIWIAVLGICAVFSLAQIITSIFYLRSAGSTKVCFVVVCTLQLLFLFPIGTPLGAYSLWAVMRDEWVLMRREPLKRPMNGVVEN